MAKGGADQFANLAVISVTESAANTLTFKKLETGISLFEKIAWIIHRVEYFMDILAASFDGNADFLDVGLSTTDQLTTVSFSNNAVLDKLQVQRSDWGAAANAILQEKPLYKDFTNLPGGGLIIPPNPVYGFACGGGQVSARSVTIRLFYTTLVMTPDQYWELVEARRIISST